MEEICTLQEELRKQNNSMITLKNKMKKNQEAWADTLLMYKADVLKVNKGGLDICLHTSYIKYYTIF